MSMANPFSDDLLLLFSHLVSNSNPHRDAAEEMLLYLSKNHPELLCLRTSLLLFSSLDDMRFVAAVILRKFFTPTSDVYLWPRLSPFCQFYLRIILLLSLEEERIRHVANAKSDTIAELASHLVPLYPQYPELLRFVLVPMAKREPQILVEANLRIFSRIAKPLAEMLVPHIPELRSILLTCITHSTLSFHARVAAISASCSLVQSLPPENCSKFQNLLSFFGYVIVDALYYKKKPMVVPEVLQLMIDFAGADPNFFHCFVKELDTVMSILASASGVSDLVEEGTRRLTLEFAITLAEAKKPASGKVRRMPLCWPQLLAILLNMLLDVGDNMAWLGAQPESQEPNQSGNYTFALEYLDRFVSALGGNEVLKAAVDMLQAYLTDPDRKKRHVSFIALARIFEGCSKNINMKGQFHGTVLTALVAAMDDFENPCTQASAATALTKFIEKCNDDILIPYLDEIVGKLVLLIKQGNQLVQKQALFALTNVADAVSDKYYDAVVPQLMHILRNATNQTNKMFLAMLADCISVIGLSAGKDKFSVDAHGVMGVLIWLQSSLNPDDPAIICFWTATETLCQCLDRDFLPYIGQLMKPLLESARLKPSYLISSAYSVAHVQSVDDMGTETLSVRGKRFSLGNSFMAKKVFVCNILSCYVKVLKEHFLPWTIKVTHALAPFIRSKYHVEVKKASARAMPELLNSAEMAIQRRISQGQAEFSVKEMLGFMLPLLLDGIHKEQDVKTCGIILESLCQCLKMSGRHLTEYQIGNIVEEMKYLITSSDAREKINTGDLILKHVGACLSVLINTYGVAFLPFFYELSKHIIPMLVSEESVRIRRLSLRIFNDIADKCEHAAVRYYDEYLVHLLVACDDSDPYIRQDAMFGVGICAKFGGSCFEPFLSVALEKINNVMQSPNADTFGNAVSALRWICEFHKLSTGAKASAAMALTNFIEKCNDDILILMPHLDEIVGKLVLLVKEGKQMVRERAVSALTNVAELVSGKFTKCYDAVVPQLLHIFMDVMNTTNKMFLAKLADCISVFGLFAGKGKFGKHARKVMEVLMSLHSSLNPVDPATKYVMQATSTICRCIDCDFLPYMDTLMKLLLESGQLKPDYEIASACSVADVQNFDDMGSETPRLKRKRISLGNSFLERKVLACDILLTYVEVLQEHFFPWTKKVILALAPLIQFKYHVDVRRLSAGAMPQLLNSAKMAIERGISQDHEELFIKQMFGFILPELLDGIHKEQDIKTCGVFLESLSDCLQLSARYLKQYQIRYIMEEIKYLITSNDARSRKRENIKTEDYYGEEGVINTENELEGLILEQIFGCLAILIDTCRTAFLPFFDELSNHIIPMLVSEESIQKRRLSLIIFVNLAEKCGYAAVRYYDEYLPHLLVACNDNNPFIRENGVFGVGICAKFGGSGFEPFLSEALAKINNIIQIPNALAYETAVLTLGWICKFHKFRTRSKAIITWLNCLPIIHDLEVAEVVHELLCSMVESSDRQLLGEKNKHLTKIISVFTEILSSDENLATEQTRNRMVMILKGLKNTMPQSTLDGMLLSLSNMHQHAFRAILKTKGLAAAVRRH